MSSPEPTTVLLGLVITADATVTHADPAPESADRDDAPEVVDGGQ